MSSSGRKLIGSPILLQDWDDEAEEGAAKYWELFLDLLMVAAASAVADGLKDNPTLQGLQHFVVLFFIFINGWMLYTHQITSRFEDSSLLHSMILFVFILGNAICITNASFETAPVLAFGALLQRLSVMVMMVFIYSCIPRARALCVILAKIVAFTSILFVLTMFAGENLVYTTVLLWVAVLVEAFLEFIVVYNLSRDELVPVNIEHSKDRLGILLLVMLGETIISTTIEYRRLAEKEEIPDYAAYYWVLFWALVLVFFYTLLFFAMTPPPSQHAFRRSKLRGCLLLISHKLLCGSVLAVGTGVKLTIEAVAAQEELTDFCVNLMSASVGCSLLLLFAQRVLHYGGVFPRGHEPPKVIRLFHVWWGFFGVASILPFLGILFGIKDPVQSIAMFAVMLFGVCLVESTFTHILEEYLRDEGEESERLTTSNPTSYQST